MRLFLLSVLMLFSTSTFARQYFQCSNSEAESTDVMVLNLTTPQYGTLFISSGMQNPEDERILLEIELEKIKNAKHFYQVINAQRSGVLIIPSVVIGKSMDHVNVNLSFSGSNFKFSCFTRIYND